ncbi:18079_t:CDS:2 [Gigaspora margarita]|uniref:18079_t:CDS:1 n=1 Tax=Gigaspora margarita TaxID=4874 RepID=A0ABN7W7I2_GIGMA|nr:18079_t:CDS:2 [Gigaspora margarita]
MKFTQSGRKSQIEKEAKTAYKRDLNTTKIEPTVTTPSRKVILELLESGTTDYSTDEVQKQITDQGLEQAEEIEEFTENRHKEVILKEVIDSLVQDEENSMMISFGPDNIPSPILQKSEVYNFTLWNIPKEVQANRIRRCLNFYRKATIVQTQEHGRTKAVYVQLIFKATSRIEALKKAWAIHFEGEKTVHISSGEFNSNTIQKRKKFYAIIKNLSKDALESSMLRQFKKINAKMVHIPENSNKN